MPQPPPGWSSNIGALTTTTPGSAMQRSAKSSTSAGVAALNV